MIRGSRQWISKFDFYVGRYSSLDHFKLEGYRVTGLSDAAKIALDTVNTIRVGFIIEIPIRGPSVAAILLSI